MRPNGIGLEEGPVAQAGRAARGAGGSGASVRGDLGSLQCDSDWMGDGVDAGM